MRNTKQVVLLSTSMSVDVVTSFEGLLYVKLVSK